MRSAYLHAEHMSTSGPCSCRSTVRRGGCPANILGSKLAISPTVRCLVPSVEAPAFIRGIKKGNQWGFSPEGPARTAARARPALSRVRAEAQAHKPSMGHDHPVV